MLKTCTNHAGDCIVVHDTLGGKCPVCQELDDAQEKLDELTQQYDDVEKTSSDQEDEIFSLNETLGERDQRIEELLNEVADLKDDLKQKGLPE
jgi:septal ring factor EnvC (AmiA/AmiB activator)